MTRRHLRNIERTDAQRVRKVTFNLVARWKSREEEPLAAWELELLDSMRNLDRRDYVWSDSAETPTSGTETGLDGDEGGREVP